MKVGNYTTTYAPRWFIATIIAFSGVYQIVSVQSVKCDNTQIRIDASSRIKLLDQLWDQLSVCPTGITLHSH